MINKEHQKIKKENTNRTIINVPISLDEKFRDLAIKRGIAKSQMILFAMSWYLDYSNSMDLIPKMLEFLNNIDDSSKSEKIENSDKC